MASNELFDMAPGVIVYSGNDARGHGTTHGQLGNGTTTNSLSPVNVVEL